MPDAGQGELSIKITVDTDAIRTAQQLLRELAEQLKGLQGDLQQALGLGSGGGVAAAVVVAVVAAGQPVAQERFRRRPNS
jgi:homoserine kinase